MAVEKMKIMSIIGKLTDLDKVSRFIVMNGSTHILNALSELDSNSLNLSASQKHMQTLQELAHLRPYISRRDFSRDEETIKFFQELFGLKPEICEDHLSIEDDYGNIMTELSKVYYNVRNTSEDISKREANVEKLKLYLDNVRYLRNTDLRIEEIRNMNFMGFRLLMLSNENFTKLKLNIENVPSIVFQVAALNGNTVIAAITPKSLEEEAKRIFVSLNYKELELPQELSGTAEEVIKQINDRIENEKRQIEELKKPVKDLNETYRDAVSRVYSLLELEKKAE
ncbi:MAG: hypothetical protein VB106_20615, partial [Clostridiaceae bacterium]|nr:hypothetical protein [Clostridiaceae bacterium]